MNINWDLLKFLWILNLKRRYKNTILGFTWYFIWSILNTILYIIIFSKIMIVKLPNISSVWAYGIYLATGLITWTMFANISLKEAITIHENKNFLKKIAVPLYYFYIINLLSEYTIYLINFHVLLIIINTQIHINFIWYVKSIISSLLLALFGFCIGMIISILSVFLEDLLELFRMILNFWFWLTPIVYLPTIIPDNLRWIINLNPLLFPFSALHSLIIPDTLDMFHKLYSTFIFVNICIAAHILYKKTESNIRDLL